MRTVVDPPDRGKGTFIPQGHNYFLQSLAASVTRTSIKIHQAEGLDRRLADLPRFAAVRRRTG
jgi:hypothetical protein